MAVRLKTSAKDAAAKKVADLKRSLYWFLLFLSAIAFSGARNIKSLNLMVDGSIGEAMKISPTIASMQGSALYHRLAAPPPKVDPTKVVEFERQEGVVIVTKLHGKHQLMLLEQSFCLLHYAYNNRVNYDIVLFTTDYMNETDLVNLHRLVAPANLTIVKDNKGLQNEIRDLTPIRRQNFLQSCGVSSAENLTWWSMCPGRIAYNWQAEFRSWHIWKHPALARYHTMMWLDTDGFSTRVWDRDPVAFMLKNELKIFFDNWPQGTGRGVDIQERIVKSFNKTLCGISIGEDGRFRSNIGGNCPSAGVPLIHGFFHITDLDFYRSDAVMHWAKTLIGDCFLCRKYDDQVAVTVPAAMLAPELAADFRRSGIKLEVYHNTHLDGKERAGGFLKWWRDNGATKFPEALGKCPIVAGG